MKKVMRIAASVAAGMGMVYVLFGVCGPYWSNMIATDRGEFVPAIEPFEVVPRPRDSIVEIWNVRNDGTIEIGGREVGPIPQDDELNVIIKIDNRPVDQSILRDQPQVGLLIGEIESDVYGADR